MTKFEKRLIAQILTAAMAFTCFTGVNPTDRAYAAEVQDEQQTEIETTAQENETSEAVKTETTAEQADVQTFTDQDYTYHLNADGNVVIDGYEGTLENLDIPKQLGGKTVVTIGQEAFYEKGIKGVTVPNTVTSIEYLAFAESDLTNITFEQGSALQKIANRSFEHSEIKNIEIPDSVIELGEYAFSSTKLESCTLSNGLKEIADGVFVSDKFLKTIEIPDNIRKIGEYTFCGCSGLETVTFGNQLESIGEEAFADCETLKKIEIPDSVTEIRKRAFAGCNSLSNVKFSKNIEKVEASGFEGCPITEVTLGDKVKSIEQYAFADNQAITSLSIPSSVTEIQYHAFAAKNLKDIQFSNNLEKISGFAFDHTAWYENQPDGMLYTGSAFYGYKGDMPQNYTADIQAGTKGIASFAFYQRSELTDVKIPEGVTTIGMLAFEDCSSLHNIKIPYSVTDIEPGAVGYEHAGWGEGIVIDAGYNNFNVKKIDNVAITGYAGTAAENYAKENEITFIALTAPESITLSQTSVSLKKNETVQISTDVQPENAEDKTVTWSTSNGNVATVSADGTVTTVGSGTAEITATTVNGIKSVCSVTVEKDYNVTLTGLKAASAGKNKVSLSWDKVDGADGYIVYAKKNGTYAYCGMTTKGTTYTDTKALDTEYNFYWVYPYQTDKTANKKNIGNCAGYVYAKGVLPAATNFKAKSAGKNKVSLSWDKVDGADGYIVYAKKNGTYAYCGMTTKGTSYTDAKALDGDYNFYWVYPYTNNADGKRVIGTGSKYVYAKGVLPAVSNLKASGTKSGVTVSWSKMKDATGYIIYKKNAQTGKFEYLSMTGNASYVDKTASKTAYNFYRVYAYYKDANGKRVLGTSDTYVYAKSR